MAALDTTSLIAKYAFLSPRDTLDYPAVNCPAEELVGFLQKLRDDEGFTFLADVTAIDHYEASPRFEVVYHLYHLEKHTYVRVATPCADDEEPSVPTISGLWAGANWHERETYDMFGIKFDGHPDLRRILMWESYPYFPLRKEFPLAGHEVELPADDVVDRTGVKVKPAPMMGGPFHAPQRGTMRRREPRADDESWTEASEKDELQAVNETPREFQGTAD